MIKTAKEEGAEGSPPSKTVLRKLRTFLNGRGFPYYREHFKQQTVQSRIDKKANSSDSNQFKQRTFSQCFTHQIHTRKR